MGCFGFAVVTAARAQAPAPALVRVSEAKAVISGPSSFGEPVPTAVVKNLEQMLHRLALNDARSIAGLYARSDGEVSPGLHQLGTQLLAELDAAKPGFDFRGVVTHNPAFWMAERELSVSEPSLPYLVSMLAVLNHDYATAARLLSLAQATLPLPPGVRRNFARPEAMLLVLDDLLARGVPAAAQMENVDQCDRAIAIVRGRIAQYSNRLNLVRQLADLEVRRAELAAAKRRVPADLSPHLRDLLRLSTEDEEFLRQTDPIFAVSLDETMRTWKSGRTLAQRWSRWLEHGEAADADAVEEAVQACLTCGRIDLAWLNWRGEMAVRGIVNPVEARRWQLWCGPLLDAKSAAYVEDATKRNPRAGALAQALPEGDFGEGWSGDPNVHPMLAIRAERQLALVDVMLMYVPPHSALEARYRGSRAIYLVGVGAVDGARNELRKAMAIVGPVSAVKMIEAQLLGVEEHYAESNALYAALMKRPGLELLKVNYCSNLFAAGDYAKAAVDFAAYAKQHPDDVYRAIFSDLTARRVHRRSTEALKVAKAKADPEAWEVNGLRYLLGEITEEQLVDSTRSGSMYDVMAHRCEVDFWLGEVALSEERRDDGILWLSRCVSTGMLNEMEYYIALAELKRLDPQAADKARKGASRDRGVRLPT